MRTGGEADPFGVVEFDGLIHCIGTIAVLRGAAKRPARLHFRCFERRHRPPATNTSTGAGRRACVFRRVCYRSAIGLGEIADRDRIGGNHLAGDPAEQRAPAQIRIGNRSSSDMISAAPATISGMLMARPSTSSDHIAAGRRGNGDDVVQAHDDVGDDDDAHRAPEMLDRLGLGRRPAHRERNSLAAM